MAESSDTKTYQTPSHSTLDRGRGIWAEHAANQMHKILDHSDTGGGQVDTGLVKKESPQRPVAWTPNDSIPTESTDLLHSLSPTPVRDTTGHAGSSSGVRSVSQPPRKCTLPFLFGNPRYDPFLFTFPNTHIFGDSQSDVPFEPSQSRQLIVYQDGSHQVDTRHTDAEELESDVPETKDVTKLKLEDEGSCAPVQTETQSAQSMPDGGTPPCGLYIAPDDPRRSKSQYSNQKSLSRTRSPSVPLDSAGRIAFATMYGDKSFYRDVSVNEAAVAKLLINGLNYTNKTAKGGWVYAVRDPMLNLVKIGFTQTPPSHRLGHLSYKCKLRDKARLIENPGSKCLLAFKQLEKLVHTDLLPHRWFWDCECGVGEGTTPESKARWREHHEWYDVSDDVAIQTIQLWTDFLSLNPYGDLREPGRYRLQETLLEKVERRKDRGENESHEAHGMRLARWRKLFQLDTRESQPIDTTIRVIENKGHVLSSKSATSSPQPAAFARRLHETRVVVNLPKPPQATPEASRGETVVLINGGPINADWPSDDNVEESAISTNRHKSEYVPAISNLPSSLPPHDSISNSSLPSSGANQQERIAAESKIFPAIATAPGPAIKDEHAKPASDSARNSSDNQEVIQSIEEPASAETHPGSEPAGAVPPTLALQDIFHMLREHQKELPWPKIYADLIKFRWQLACFVMFALHAPFSPSLLSILTWSAFLPFFVAELRGWV